MGFDYYIIKELRINFFYNNVEYNINKELDRHGMYFENNSEYDYHDSDDEYYYMKYLKSKKSQMDRYNYTRDIVRDESYVNQDLSNKYNELLKEIIENNFETFVVYSDIKLIKVQKCQYTQER
jgi:hypothetical protein